eukprot:GHVT01028812.1.p1 GENE.GHVT01028812.1~~GHVT01028812.1.p1  ORF type:complete len:502 (-),score=107.14 GHVT01028812.1:477-1982(-)
MWTLSVVRSSILFFFLFPFFPPCAGAASNATSRSRPWHHSLPSSSSPFPSSFPSSFPSPSPSSLSPLPPRWPGRAIGSDLPARQSFSFVDVCGAQADGQGGDPPGSFRQLVAGGRKRKSTHALPRSSRPSFSAAAVSYSSAYSDFSNYPKLSHTAAPFSSSPSSASSSLPPPFFLLSAIRIHRPTRAHTKRNRSPQTARATSLAAMAGGGAPADNIRTGQRILTAERSVNKVTLLGRVGGDPDVRVMPSGERVANFNVATGETWRDKATGEVKGRTEWHRVTVYDQVLVDLLEKFVRKGRRVFVEGAMHTRRWVAADGHERYSTEVVLGRYRGEIVLLDEGKSSANQQQNNLQNNGNDFQQPQTNQLSSEPYNRYYYFIKNTKKKKKKKKKKRNCFVPPSRLNLIRYFFFLFSSFVASIQLPSAFFFDRRLLRRRGDATSYLRQLPDQPNLLGKSLPRVPITNKILHTTTTYYLLHTTYYYYYYYYILLLLLGSSRPQFPQ